MVDQPPQPGIPCPLCGDTANSVVRTTAYQGYVSRRRQCRGCANRFTTEEKIPGLGPLPVAGSAISVAHLLKAAEFLGVEVRP